MPSVLLLTSRHIAAGFAPGDGGSQGKHVEPECSALLGYMEEGSELVKELLVVEFVVPRALGVPTDPVDRDALEMVEERRDRVDGHAALVLLEVVQRCEGGGQRPPLAFVADLALP